MAQSCSIYYSQPSHAKPAHGHGDPCCWSKQANNLNHPHHPITTTFLFAPLIQYLTMPDLVSMPYPHLTSSIDECATSSSAQPPLAPNPCIVAPRSHCSWRLKGLLTWHGICVDVDGDFHIFFTFISNHCFMLSYHSGLFQGCRMLVQLTSTWQLSGPLRACSRHCSKSLGWGGYQIVNIVNKPWGWTIDHSDTGIQTEVLVSVLTCCTLHFGPLNLFLAQYFCTIN